MACSIALCATKFVMCIINLIVFLVGLSLLIMGVLLKTNPNLSKQSMSGVLKKLEDSAEDAGVTDLDTTSFSVAQMAYSFITALIVVGSVLMGLSLMGMIGSTCNCQILLNVYFNILLIMFLAQVILVLILIIDKSVFDKGIKGPMKINIKDNYQGLEGTSSTSLMWNGIMLQLGCCGVDDSNDFAIAESWSKTINGKNYPLTTPIACCKTISESYECATDPTDDKSNWKTGCYDKIWNYLFKGSFFLPAIIAISLIVQLAVLIETAWVLRRAEESDEPAPNPEE